MRRKLKITEYNPKWLVEFNKIKSVYLSFLSELDITVEHVGSTSIIGCYAKPIIDIDIVLKDFNKFEDLKELFISLGYIHEGDKGIKGRESFRRKNAKVPLFSNNKYDFCHHVYVLHQQSLPLKNHLLFRDYLINHPEEMKIYSSLKLNLLSNGVTREEYSQLKTDYIISVLKKAGLSEFHLELIRKENT